MRRCNHMRVFHINTYGHHGTSNNEQSQATNASRFLPLSLLHRQGYFIPIIDVHLRQGEQVSKTTILSDLTPEEGE
jgi:hypothetical protein